MPEVLPLFKRSGTSELLTEGVTPEAMVASMDRAGVKTVMLSAWHRRERVIISNDTVAEYVRRFPDRFAGVAAVNLEKPVEAVRELDRAVKRVRL